MTEDSDMTLTEHLDVDLPVATVLGLVTFIVRYRNHRSSLLSVIKREGGLYLLSSLGESRQSLQITGT